MSTRPPEVCAVYIQTLMPLLLELHLPLCTLSPAHSLRNCTGTPLYFRFLISWQCQTDVWTSDRFLRAVSIQILPGGSDLVGPQTSLKVHTAFFLVQLLPTTLLSLKNKSVSSTETRSVPSAGSIRRKHIKHWQMCSLVSSVTQTPRKNKRSQWDPRRIIVWS